MNRLTALVSYKPSAPMWLLTMLLLIPVAIGLFTATRPELVIPQLAHVDTPEFFALDREYPTAEETGGFSDTELQITSLLREIELELSQRIAIVTTEYVRPLSDNVELNAGNDEGTGSSNDEGTGSGNDEGTAGSTKELSEREIAELRAEIAALRFLMNATPVSDSTRSDNESGSGRSPANTQTPDSQTQEVGFWTFLYWVLELLFRDLTSHDWLMLFAIASCGTCFVVAIVIVTFALPIYLFSSNQDRIIRAGSILQTALGFVLTSGTTIIALLPFKG